MFTTSSAKVNLKMAEYFVEGIEFKQGQNEIENKGIVKIPSEGTTELLTLNNRLLGSQKSEEFGDATLMKYRGNIIAIATIDGVWIRDAGFKTVTTKIKLNCLLKELKIPGCGIEKRKNEFYYNGRKWDGKLMKIKN